MLNSQLQLENYHRTKRKPACPPEKTRTSAGGGCALSSLRKKQARTGSGPSGPGEGLLPTRDAPAAFRWAELADSFIRMQAFLLCLARMEKG